MEGKDTKKHRPFTHRPAWQWILAATLIVALIGAGVFGYQQAHEEDVVSDAVASEETGLGAPHALLDGGRILDVLAERAEASGADTTKIAEEKKTQESEKILRALEEVRDQEEQATTKAAGDTGSSDEKSSASAGDQKENHKGTGGTSTGDSKKSGTQSQKSSTSGKSSGSDSKNNTASNKNSTTASSKSNTSGSGSNTSGNKSNNTSSSGNASSGSTTPPPPKDKYCTISVVCYNATNVRDQYPQYASVIPSSGVILGTTTIKLQSGDTVYSVLTRSGVSVDARQSGYGVYIAAIGGLYEKYCGGSSGWMYSVNGSYPGTACSNYTVSDGDSIVWSYTVRRGDL